MNILYTLALLPLFFLYSHLSLYAVITPCPSLDFFKEQVRAVEKNSLIVFDVDETILTSQDKILRPCGKTFLKNYISEAMRKGFFGKRPYAELRNLVISSMRTELFDPSIVSFIAELQQRGVAVIALTAMKTGTIKENLRSEEWRYNQLLAYGIDLSSSFSSHPDLELMVSQETGKPRFYKGIICTDGVPKGACLKAFLDQLQYTPTKIYFLDDCLDFVESVQESMDAMNIPCDGFHYTYFDNVQESVDEEVAAYQLQTLFTESQWISDDAARERLSKTYSERHTQ